METNADSKSIVVDEDKLKSDKDYLRQISKLALEELVKFKEGV